MEPTPITTAIAGALASLPTTRNESQKLVSFSGWRPAIDEYESTLKSAADACAKMVRDMEAGVDPYWLTLVGEYGCGKTFLARQLFSEAKRINPGNPANNPIWPPNWRDQVAQGVNIYGDARPYCLWFDEKDFADRMKGGEYDLPESVRGDYLVVFDELGFSRDPTKFIAEGVARLCQSRLRQWMVFCTNLDSKELSEKVDGRVTSRLIRDENKVISIKAGDYALRQRESA